MSNSWKEVIFSRSHGCLWGERLFVFPSKIFVDQVTVLDDTANGWPGKCRGLVAPELRLVILRCQVLQKNEETDS